jgi:hypothetical protein
MVYRFGRRVCLERTQRQEKRYKTENSILEESTLIEPHRRARRTTPPPARCRPAYSAMCRSEIVCFAGCFLASSCCADRARLLRPTAQYKTTTKFIHDRQTSQRVIVTAYGELEAIFGRRGTLQHRHERAFLWLFVVFRLQYDDNKKKSRSQRHRASMVTANNRYKFHKRVSYSIDQ